MTYFHLSMVISGCILWACIEGVREAWYFDLKMRATRKPVKNEHILFTAQRLIVFAALAYSDGLITSIPMFFSYWLIFPFFHDGMYHMVRNNIDNNIYPDRWVSDPDPKSSNALLDFPFWMRLLMLMCGIGLLVMVLIII